MPHPKELFSACTRSCPVRRDSGPIRLTVTGLKAPRWRGQAGVPYTTKLYRSPDNEKPVADEEEHAPPPPRLGAVSCAGSGVSVALYLRAKQARLLALGKDGNEPIRHYLSCLYLP
jgi:hypothetical protein